MSGLCIGEQNEIPYSYAFPRALREVKPDALAGKINEIDPRKLLLVFVNEVGHESRKEWIVEDRELTRLGGDEDRSSQTASGRMPRERTS